METPPSPLPEKGVAGCFCHLVTDSISPIPSEGHFAAALNRTPSPGGAPDGTEDRGRGATQDLSTQRDPRSREVPGGEERGGLWGKAPGNRGPSQAEGRCEQQRRRDIAGDPQAAHSPISTTGPRPTAYHGHRFKPQGSEYLVPVGKCMCLSTGDSRSQQGPWLPVLSVLSHSVLPVREEGRME